MDIRLVEATIEDAEELYIMQVKAFMPLLDKYGDYYTNPANEPISKFIERISFPLSDFYIIKCDGISVGGIRIINLENNCFRVSPVYIIPEYQGLGIAHRVFGLIEQKYPYAKSWYLETILEEEGNCRLYEKLGYEKTGVFRQVKPGMTLVNYQKRLQKLK